MHIKSFRRRTIQAACCVLSLLATRSIASAAGGKEASADDLDVLPGFKIETVLVADKKTESWISLSKDSQGRLFLAGQRGQPATRVTLDADGKITKKETLKLPVSEIMGQLFVGDALYVDGAGKNPEGK